MKKWSREPQVIGKYIISIVKVSPDFEVTNKILLSVGLKTIEPGKWYPLALLLRFFIQLQKSKGEDFLFELGKTLVKTTSFPASVKTFQSALSSLDLGYTIDHRNQIGGMYGTKSTTSQRMDIIAANPYPCPFDWGILQEIVHIYAPSAKLSHDFSSGCRLDGDHACRYTIDF